MLGNFMQNIGFEEALVRDYFGKTSAQEP